jgi:DNA repair exonuclease SbcCD ATPase subunit
MIILKHLTVERFRLLHEINLHFPQRGSILIQGPNESGKSALLESIYFALYGEPLAMNSETHSLDDLISYGATTAVVTLTLSIGATQLTVMRTIERGKGQKVSLYVRRLSMPEEGPITRLGAANERIIAELGRMDGPTLRNSCLIEQKGLGRLETISGAAREASARKLLGLERLTRVTEQFKLTSSDERLLAEAAGRLRLAEVQSHIPRLSKRFEEIEAALDAVLVVDDLAVIAQQEEEIAEQEQALEQISSQRLNLKSRIARVQQLKTADATLGEIVLAYDKIAHAKEELPAIEKQMEDLERREREELPALERRVNELADLTRSFGTLQRMSSDLLAAVDTIKELEHEQKYQEEVREDLASLDQQIAHAQEQVEQAKSSLQALEERRRAGRPQLEARLQRLRILAERLANLKELEGKYEEHLYGKESAGQKEERLRKAQHDLAETEQELTLVEAEVRQAQQQAEGLERRARQLSIRRQLEEWQRLKGLAKGIADAEQHLHAAHEQQEKLTRAAIAARDTVRWRLILLVAAAGLLLISVAAALYEVTQSNYLLATVAGLLALFFVAGVGLGTQNYLKSRTEQQVKERQAQEATSRVGMMSVAREAALRMGGSREDLAKVEREIVSLGGVVPGSLEEARRLLQQVPDKGESIADVQKRAKEKREEANAARNQLNVTMEAVAALRKECAQLEEQRARESWNGVDETLRFDLAALHRLHQEITLLAGQEGLPQSSVNKRLQRVNIEDEDTLIPLSPEESTDLPGLPELEGLVEDTLRTTEREIAALDGKLDLVTDLTRQVKIHQEALDVLLARRRTIEERNERYQTNNPAQQVEKAREQQNMLRGALQALQESLRQRVKQVGITFGQAAILAAESAARKQLEELHLVLAGKLKLQQERDEYVALLAEQQDALSNYYKQLAKSSNMLGSWIVPPNPFAEALTALRTRCQQEIQDAKEHELLKELDVLQMREGAARAKIELCQQETENAQERIAVLLIQRHRPKPKNYSRDALIAVWPLIDAYSSQDRARLEQERAAVEQELTEYEQQELTLSQQLQTGGARLDLDLARLRMEQQERSYQTKKRGLALVQAVSERLMRKTLPRTEYYMQQLLPLLTSGRYHDVHVYTEPEEGTSSGGPLHLRVWDSAAGEYVAKSALSGGTADQLSLALRLAFAITILPRELNTAPGFLILDEPLSSLDRRRTQALVDVMAGELVGQHFEQILLVSQSSAFDPAMFPYHIYLDNGLLIESNLPVAASQPHAAAAPANSRAEDEELDGDATVHIAALPTSLRP